MITEKQKEKLMGMVKHYGVEESLRGMFAGFGYDEAKIKRQERFCVQKLDQIQTFLDNITKPEY
jgi:hypothetical protein